MPNYINKVKLPNNDVYEIQDANALPKTTQINGTSADSSTGNYTLTGDDIDISSSYNPPSSGTYSAPAVGDELEVAIGKLAYGVTLATEGSITSVDEAQDSHLDITTATGGAVTVDVADGYVIPSATVGTPAESGTAVSLVSTGNMYTWNDKQSGITMDIGETPVTTRIADGNKNTKLIGGTAVELVADTTNGTITINSSDTKYSDFVGSGTGHAAGLVPDPGATESSTKFLCEDGTWATPAGKNYTAGTGIDISNADVISNTGVTSVTESTGTDGTILVSTAGATAVEVAVKGLDNAAYKDVDTTIDTTTPSANLPTSAAVDTYVKNAISGITGPMIYKGGISVAADRALTVPQTVTSIKQGYTFKVTSSAVATIKVGDTFIADQDNASTATTWVEDTDWTVVPSGDDEGKTYPCFTYIEETESSGTVKYIGIDYGD